MFDAAPKYTFVNKSGFCEHIYKAAILIWPLQILIQLALSFPDCIPTVKHLFCLYVDFTNKGGSRIVLVYTEDRGSKPYETSVPFNQFTLCHMSQVAMIQ
jgi:hypothetical protein